MRESIIAPADVHPGKIEFDDLILDTNLSIDDQLDDLKEDLLLVAFPNTFVLAVGWFPEFKASGRFGITLARNPETNGWDQPVAKKRCRSFPELREIVLAFVEIAKRSEN